MIIVDASVVIDYIRGQDPKLQALLLAFPVAICGVTRAEVLCGSRDPAHRQKLIVTLAPFHFVSLPDSLWDTVGDNLAALRSKGITVPLADAVIATLGIENDVEVWARDPHFPLIQKVLPRLKLFQEPP
jgi:predicted nucleic acid-binding protein